MGSAPVTMLSKKKVDYLGTHYCKHGHTYLEHYSCYLNGNHQGEKVGYFDIECTNLNADYGYMLCYCIKVGGEDTIIRGVIDKKDLEKNLDRVLVTQCLKDLAKFDRIFTYYGTKFDIPYLKARALIHGIPITSLSFGSRFHKDMYYVAKRNLKISSRRLENVSRLLIGSTRKTHLEPTIWTYASMGDKKSLDYVVNHCDGDVLDLEDVHMIMDSLFIMRDTSI